MDLCFKNGSKTSKLCYTVYPKNAALKKTQRVFELVALNSDFLLFIEPRFFKIVVKTSSGNSLKQDRSIDTCAGYGSVQRAEKHLLKPVFRIRSDPKLFGFMDPDPDL